MSFTLETHKIIFNDENGERITVRPHGAIDNWIEIQSSLDGKDGQFILLSNEQAKLVVQAIIELVGV